MPTIVKKYFDRRYSRPSATSGILWSLGLHAAAFAASYSWWSIPIAHVSFAGNRFVVQIEATFSEMPAKVEIEEEIEIMLEFETVPPVEELLPEPLPPFEPKLVVDPSSLQLQNDLLQDDEAYNIFVVKPPDSSLVAKEHPEINPVESPIKPQPESDQPPRPEATAGSEQLAGIEEKAPPDLTGNQPPIYPAEAIQRRLEGLVLLRITIAETGMVEQVKVAKSSGHAILDRTAVEAVSSWHAQPAEIDGKPVEAVEMLPVHFKL